MGDRVIGRPFCGLRERGSWMREDAKMEPTMYLSCTPKRNEVNEARVNAMTAQRSKLPMTKRERAKNASLEDCECLDL